MADRPGQVLLPWLRPGWRESAEAWLVDRLEALGVRITGPVENPRTRFWSILLTVETDAGRFWFKENCPQQAFEARLLDELTRHVPDRVLRVAACEPSRGWILSPDQSPILREVHDPTDATGWQRLLVDYAVLQRRLIDAGADLRDCGLTVLHPLDAVDYLTEQVEVAAALPPADPGRLAEDDAERLRSMRPALAGWAEQLAATGLPLTLEHSDLHDGNAFLTAANQPLRIFDFGDSVWSFPLCSLLVPSQMMRAGPDHPGPDHPGLPPTEVWRVLDSYLEVFGDLVPVAELRRALPAALEVAKLNRHESWRRVLRSAGEEDYARFGPAPAEWLARIGVSAD